MKSIMNPFRETIVASPWSMTTVDLSEIHNAAFDACLQGLDGVRSRRHSAAILVHGEAGSGKTHLLARLRSRLAPQAPVATDRPESLFVWCRLQTSPSLFWRSLRRTIVEDWFRPVENGRPQIDRILFHRLAALRPAEWDLEPWYEYMLEEDPEGLEELIEQISRDLHLDHNLATAFRHLAFHRHRRELRAWLSGTSLPESVLNRMELAREDGTEEELEDQARQIVLMLCQLTGSDLPILLSFDQVEALQSHPGDAEGLFIFGQAIGTLHDQTSNVLLVSCMQSAFANELKTHVRGADYDRLTSWGALSLQPLNHTQAEQLISVRRESAGLTLPEDQADNTVWPLDPAEFEALLENGSITPRRLLNVCAERFDHPGETTPFHESQPVSPQQRLIGFLAEQLQSELNERRQMNTPDRTEELIQHGLPLIMNLLFPAVTVARDPELPDVSPIFVTDSGKLGLSICTQSNMTSLASRLRRLKTQWEMRGLERLVLIRDERIPLSEGARKVRTYLDELEQRKVVTVTPDVETLAMLDAVRNLLSNARSGDLSLGGDVISPQRVEGWLRESLPECLLTLMEQILGRRVSG